MHEKPAKDRVSCAVVRLRCMTHWWRSRLSKGRSIFLKHKRQLISPPRREKWPFLWYLSPLFEFATSITFDTGGEVEDLISGCLLHDPLKGRDARLFRRFSSQPAHQLNEVDGGSNRHMTQMGFAQTDVA